MLSAVWDLLFFCIALGILVTVHEAGHFFAARCCKVKVLRFSVGFGRQILTRRGRDGCEYSLSLIPLGGYVKMQGENDDSTAEGSFRQKSLKARAFIIAAGPLCNVLLSFMLYTLVNVCGVEQLRPVVGDVVPNSRAERAGLSVSSEITSLNGAEVRSWADVVLGIMTSDGKSVTLETVPFMDEGSSGSHTLPLDGVSLDPDSDVLGGLGLKRMVGRVESVITTVQAGSPAERAGIAVGDRIVSIDGQDTSSWYRVLDAVRASEGRELRLLVERGGKVYETAVQPDLVYSQKEHRSIPRIGAGITVNPVPALSHTVSYGPADAAAKAFDDTARMSKLVVNAIISMLSGAVSAENISGPIAIAKGAGESASIGAVFFISFLAAISVNLGILNLLPIPVLDGGQLMFIAYEALTGKAPSERVQHLLTLLGFSVLLTLMLFAVFNDIRAL